MSAHPWWRWECYENGFYSAPEGDWARNAYKEFHSSENLFNDVMREASINWVFSFENFLSNTEINRVAWLGQVSACYHLGISSFNRGAYNELSKDIKHRQNKLAQGFLEEWMHEYNSGKSGGIYCKVDEARIRERDSRRSATDIITRRVSTKLQGDLFGHIEQ